MSEHPTRPPQRLPALPNRRRPANPNGPLDGRVALVTGADGTIGAAIVERLLQLGCTVAATDVSSELRHRLHDKMLYLPLDVTSRAEWARAVRTARRQLGPVDVLIHSAGVMPLNGLDSLDQATWERAVAVNQSAVMTGIQACLSSMWQAGGGSVVTIGSVLGRVGTGASFAYHASKGAVEAMTRAAAVELAPRRIRVNAVLPGFVDSPMMSQVSAAAREEFVKATPLARFATPQDVAAAVAFLASDDCDFVTGICLPVDGGYLAR